ncbi:hypothetical protein CR513_11659, partial [Mucuna pruriens]
MQKISYASTVRSLMYAQVCTCPNIAFVVGVLVKCVMHYLKRTKKYMLTYLKSEGLETIKFSYSNFAGCQDSKHFTFGYICMLAGGAIPWKSSFTPINNRSFTKSKFINIKFLIFKERVQNKQIFIKHIGTSFMVVDPLTKGLIPKVFHEHTTHMSFGQRINSNIREYIMEMSNLATKLKSLKLELGEDLIMTNGDSMNLYLIMCKRKRGCREIRLKMLILFQLLRIRKGRTLRVLQKGLLNERNKYI